MKLWRSRPDRAADGMGVLVVCQSQSQLFQTMWSLIHVLAAATLPFKQYSAFNGTARATRPAISRPAGRPAGQIAAGRPAGHSGRLAGRPSSSSSSRRRRSNSGGGGGSSRSSSRRSSSSSGSSSSTTTTTRLVVAEVVVVVVVVVVVAVVEVVR